MQNILMNLYTAINGAHLGLVAGYANDCNDKIVIMNSDGKYYLGTFKKIGDNGTIDDLVKIIPAYCRTTKKNDKKKH